MTMTVETIFWISEYETHTIQEEVGASFIFETVVKGRFGIDKDLEVHQKL